MGEFYLRVQTEERAMMRLGNALRWAMVALWGGVLAYSFRHPEYSIFSDSRNYLKLAENLRVYSVFSLSDAPPFVPELIRVPGYPLFLMGLQYLFQSPVPWIIAAQVALAWFSMKVVSVWMAERYGWESALMVGLLWGFDVVFLFHSTYILAESVFVFFLVWAVCKFGRVLSEQTFKNAAISGALFGVALLIKPVALFFPLFVCWLLWRRKTLMLLFLFSAYLLPAAWAFRNDKVTRHFQLSVQGGFDMLKYPAATIAGWERGIPREQAEDELRRAVDEGHGRPWTNPAEQSSAYGRAALRVMAAHPLLTVKVHLLGGVRILGGTGLEIVVKHFQKEKFENGSGPGGFGHGTIQLIKNYKWLIPVFILYTVILFLLYGFYVMGLLSLVLSREFRMAVFLALGPLYFLIISSHQGYYRYRIPMMPFLVMGAGAGYFFVKNRLTRRAKRSFEQN